MANAVVTRAGELVVIGIGFCDQAGLIVDVVQSLAVLALAVSQTRFVVAVGYRRGIWQGDGESPVGIMVAGMSRKALQQQRQCRESDDAPNTHVVEFTRFLCG